MLQAGDDQIEDHQRVEQLGAVKGGATVRHIFAPSPTWPLAWLTAHNAASISTFGTKP